MDTMAAIKQTFFQECEEQLAELETGLLAIDGGDHDPETVNAVFRAVHSVKGGAGAFKLNDLVIENRVVIPVVTRPNVAAVGAGLQVELSGFDSYIWDLANWYRDT